MNQLLELILNLDKRYGGFGCSQKEGKSILVTTHVLDEATRCDRLLLMNHGEIIAIGSPQDIKTQYQAESIEDVF